MSAPEEHEPYLTSARRPLNVLAFLALPILAYELCLALLLRSTDGSQVNTVEAHRGLIRFFASFGIQPAGGLYMGGLVIVIVLVVWHILARERWRVEPAVVGLMAIEALALTVPLLLLSHLMATHFAGVPAMLASGAPPPAFGDLDLWSQMAISIGAGLYEELVFRMILIAVLHTLLVDVAKMSEWSGTVMAITLSAAAFTLYHDLAGADGAVSARKAVFYFLAGIYLGAVFALRGFGIAVGVHALYDVVTVLIARSGDA